MSWEIFSSQAGGTSVKTFIIDGEDIGIKGEILITVYEDRATMATRESRRESWNAPIRLEER